MTDDEVGSHHGCSRRAFLALTSVIPLGAASLAMPLSGCNDEAIPPANAQDAAAYRIDASQLSENQDSRVRTLVLHYTAEALEASRRSLVESRFQVSAHYLVPAAPGDDQVFTIYRLVPEERRAWHAGISYWQGDRMLNASSIGIEIVNLGFPAQDEGAPPMLRRWYPYPAAQIDVVARLAAGIIARHEILPHKVVGHSDVAPGRKSDPGPLFPWEMLFSQYQIGAWPDDEAVRYYQTHEPFDGNTARLQAKLLAYGYDAPQTGLLDGATTNVISAFQMHFRSSRYDGVPDAETVAILDALLEKYFHMGSRIPQGAQTLQGEPKPAAGVPDRGEKGSDFWPLFGM